MTIVDVTGRAKAAFDVERVTKRFYDRFKTEHDAFLKFIDGIPDDELQRWYASVMLNRSDVHLLHSEEGISRQRRELS